MAEYIEREKIITEIVAEAEKQGKKSYEMAERGCDDLSVKYTHGEYCYCVAEHIVKTAPAADVEPVKHGYWKHVAGMNSKCSECDRYFPVSEFDKRPFDVNYCPNCGAKMDGKEVRE